MRQSKGYRAILWATGVGIYLAGRIVLLNFLKAFAFLGIAASLHFSLPVEAKTYNQSSFVLDETKFMNKGVLESTHKILKEFAEKEQVNIRVLVLNDDSLENLDMLAQKKIQQFKMKNHIKDDQTIYWVLQPASKQSLFVIPQGLKRQNIKERLARVEDLIILPYLQKGKGSRALAEGTCAMTTLLLIPA